MRFGVFGGTFDPPHVGHVLTAVDAFEALELDQLLFIPNAVQPLKGGGHASPAQRLEMLRLAIGNDRRFVIDPLEIERDGLSYTVDTLVEVAKHHAGAELWLMVGADVVATFAQWKEPDRILSLARLAVLARRPEAVLESVAGEGKQDVSGLPGGAVVLGTRQIDVSSTEIRNRVRDGKSIRGFVSDAVAAYIESASLYR